MNTAKPMATRHSGDMAEVLDAMGAAVMYDRRASRLTRDGRHMTDLDIDLLIDQSVQQPQATSSGIFYLPTMRADRGRRVWHAYMANNSFDPLEDWFLDLLDSRHTPCDPASIPVWLWEDRIITPELELVEWCWRSFFLAVVARALSAQPVRWDIVPIIRGPQGCGKSTMVTNLLPAQWTNGGMPLRGVANFDSARQTMEFTEGKAILESSEMVGVSGGNREAIKAFLTRDTDRATRKYAIQAEDVPRRWCIVGTTNDDHPIPYDPTGGRRWIVTSIEGSRPDDGKRIHDALNDYRYALWMWAVEHVMSAIENGESLAEMLSVPAHLAGEHHQHVQRYMFQPRGM